VTGTSGSVGAGVAEYYSRCNRVISLSRTQNSSEKSDHFTVDLTNTAQIREFFKCLRQEGIVPYGIILNAAVLSSKHALMLSEAEIERMIQTNLLSNIYLLQMFAKATRKANRARAIFISSMATQLNPIGDSVYSASKSGVEKFIDVFSKEIALNNLTCNTLAISSFPSEMLNKIPAKKVNEIVSGLPIPRHAQIGDITNVLDFFLSEDSDFITSQKITLAGVN